MSVERVMVMMMGVIERVSGYLRWLSKVMGCDGLISVE